MASGLGLILHPPTADGALAAAVVKSVHKGMDSIACRRAALCPSGVELALLYEIGDLLTDSVRDTLLAAKCRIVTVSPQEEGAFCSKAWNLLCGGLPAPDIIGIVERSVLGTASVRDHSIVAGLMQEDAYLCASSKVWAQALANDRRLLDSLRAKGDRVVEQARREVVNSMLKYETLLHTEYGTCTMVPCSPAQLYMGLRPGAGLPESLLLYAVHTDDLKWPVATCWILPGCGEAGTVIKTFLTQVSDDYVEGAPFSVPLFRLLTLLDNSASCLS